MLNGSFHEIKITTRNTRAEDIYQDVFVLAKEREGFKQDHQLMIIPTYFYRIIGIEDETTFERKLREFDLKLMGLQQLYQKFDKGLDTTIPKELVEKVSECWCHMTLPLGIISIEDPIKNKVINEKFATVLNLYKNNEKDSYIIRNFFFKLLHWIIKYTLPQLKGYQYGEMNPKVLFYGSIHRDETYFLIFLSLIGFDIIYFNPLEGSDFKCIANIEEYTNLLEYPQRNVIEEFPMTNKINRQETIAYRASIEIDRVLHTEESGVYRPWQFQEHDLVVNSLKTTYDELLILWKEEARFRQGFRIEGNKIYIPNIFAKVSGTHRDLNIYWKNYNALLEKSESTIIIEKIPLVITRSFSSDPNLFNIDGSFNIGEIIQLKEYQFHHLSSPVQKLILSKINELVVTEGLFNFPMTEKFKTQILYTILSLEKSYLHLIQKYDYPYDIPKILIFDGDKNRFSMEYIIILAFLHFMAFDIVIFTPTGYNNIEKGIHPFYYDLHKLEELKFNIDRIGQNKNKNLNKDQNKDQEQGKSKNSLFKKSFFWFFQ